MNPRRVAAVVVVDLLTHLLSLFLAADKSTGEMITLSGTSGMARYCHPPSIACTSLIRMAESLDRLQPRLMTVIALRALPFHLPYCTPGACQKGDMGEPLCHNGEKY